jgi:putative hydrolase
MIAWDNESIAEKLLEYADLLEQRDANPYRVGACRRAARVELRTIAPRRFNPEGRSWLPTLHTQRGDWQLTALYSNTARAHELGRTRDRVVRYYHSDHDAERQSTVVTETHGRRKGRRVVRGRETEY